MEAWLHSLLGALSLPQYGLSTVFFVAMLSATLLPLGSEPAVFGLVKLNPELFWPAVLVATAGNTAGGRSAGGWATAPSAPTSGCATTSRARPARCAGCSVRAQGLPAELAAAGGRPAVRGGRLAAPAFWPCVLYMAIGKFARYVTMTAALLWVFPGRLPM
jgi:membrane protein YqaA with SNARE-associated domain